jgi:DinB family protein
MEGNAMTIVLERLQEGLFDVLDETFENVHGIYLDKNTSLFETLETISAEEASRPVSARCASIAAQVAHVRFYLDVLARHMRNENVGRVDWDEIWRTVETVTPEEWTASKNQLKASYQRVLGLMKNFGDWEGENDISASLAVLVHTAYHLGEIRQALCTIKQTG